MTNDLKGSLLKHSYDSELILARFTEPGLPSPYDYALPPVPRRGEGRGTNSQESQCLRGFLNPKPQSLGPSQNRKSSKSELTGVGYYTLQPRILSANQPYFQYLSANCNILLSQSSAIQLPLPYLFWYHSGTQWGLGCIYGQSKGCGFKMSLGIESPNSSLTFLPIYKLLYNYVWLLNLSHDGRLSLTHLTYPPRQCLIGYALFFRQMQPYTHQNIV